MSKSIVRLFLNFEQFVLLTKIGNLNSKFSYSVAFKYQNWVENNIKPKQKVELYSSCLCENKYD